MTRSVFNHRRATAVVPVLLSADSFNRTNNSNLGGSTTDGAGTKDPLTWTVQAGIIHVIGNTAAITSNSSSPANATVPVGVSDVDITMTLAGTLQTSAAMIQFRYTGQNDFLALEVANNVVPKITKTVSGTRTVLASGPLGNAAQIGDVMRIIASGSSLAMYRNGNFMGNCTETFNQSATTHGMVFNTTGWAWDNWTVYSA